MRRVIALLLLAASIFAAAGPSAARDESLRILAYHDVRDDPLTRPDRYTVSTHTLARHFEWLKASGYTVVSVDQLLRARSGGPPLPPRAVLLTFDDGYSSVYSHVFPLLKAFNYPAVIGLVGSWMEREPGDALDGDGNAAPRDGFVTWGQVRDMVLSGLVEVASHTHDLHRGVHANPQGDAFPAAIARRYDAETQRYEHDADYDARIRRDLEANSDMIARELGKRPRIIVWPYGRHTPSASRIAAETGLTIGLTLTPGANTAETPLAGLHRDLMIYDPSIGELASTLSPARALPVRVMHVDLDYVYDPDASQQRANVGVLLDRVRAMGINTVYLQAYADPDGNGAADAVYFPNRHLPVRADLFSHVAWQLHTRANVSVYAWMPVLGYESVKSFTAVERVTAAHSGKAAIPRVSPFSAAAEVLVREVYEDLARHAIFQGVLFHDDATLSDFEDASVSAARHYATHWGLPSDLALIRADKALLAEWTRRKSRHLTDYTLRLAAAIRPHQQRLATARNLYARVVLEPLSEEWFAQDYAQHLAAYDYTAIMAMPFMEGENDALPWLRRLIAAAARQPTGLTNSVFELQSRDWRSGQPIASELLAEKMRLLQSSRALHFGYYPDDFHTGHPRLDTIKPYFSLETFPYADPDRR